VEELLLSFVEYLKQFSYLGIIIALTFEFVPAEIVLPLVGYWVYKGDMNMAGAILAGAIGGTTGPLTLYALGYYGGRPLLLKYGKFFFVKEKQIRKADEFFEKYGSSVAFLGRFIPGIRTLISVPCGIAKMNVWVFSLFTFLAMLPITTIYIYLGMMLGEHWQSAGEMAKQFLLPLAAVGLIVFFCVVVYRLRNRRNIENSL
jgi:membrane protein DedA with SNARE-associated domain